MGRVCRHDSAGLVFEHPPEIASSDLQNQPIETGILAHVSPGASGVPFAPPSYPPCSGPRSPRSRPCRQVSGRFCGASLGASWRRAGSSSPTDGVSVPASGSRTSVAQAASDSAMRGLWAFGCPGPGRPTGRSSQSACVHVKAHGVAVVRTLDRRDAIADHRGPIPTVALEKRADGRAVPAWISAPAADGHPGKIRNADSAALDLHDRTDADAVDAAAPLEPGKSAPQVFVRRKKP